MSIVGSFIPVSTARRAAQLGSLRGAVAIERDDGEWELSLDLGARCARLRTSRDPFCARRWSSPLRVIAFARSLGLEHVTFSLLSHPMANANPASSQADLFSTGGSDLRQ